ncbi:MAG: hypothetical protein KDC54_09250, partial [Lewinella sp.]|nr:hypothetical protein [Lewinella sp.]
MNRLAPITLFLLACYWLSPVCPGLLAQDYLIQRQQFGVEDGLAHREVNSIFEDERGFIWLGTPLGLSRFDGQDFQTINVRTDSFLHNNIWRILPDPDGNFWLLPQPPFDDFTIWHPVTRARTTFREKFGPDAVLPDRLPNAWVVSEKDGAIWSFAKGAGLWSCHPDRGVEIIPLPGVQDFDLITADEQSLWGIAD